MCFLFKSLLLGMQNAEQKKQQQQQQQFCCTQLAANS